MGNYDVSLNNILALNDNWDGNGAKRFSEDLVNWGKELASVLPDGFYIHPVATGAIKFEYENDDKYFEFELVSCGNVSVFEKFEGKEINYGIQNVSVKKLAQMVRNNIVKG